MDTKTCTKCGVEKPLGEFCKDKTRKDGYYPNCKTCERARSRTRANTPANREKHRVYLAAWRAANREKARARDAAWRAANLEKVRAVRKKWCAENPERVRLHKKKKIETLSRAYVAKNLGVNVKDLTPELLELGRQRILNTRAMREFNATLKDLNHEQGSDQQPGERRDLAGVFGDDDGRRPPAGAGNDGGPEDGVDGA